MENMTKTPGIIGGLGPETTARIYLALAIENSTNEYPWHSYF